MIIIICVLAMLCCITYLIFKNTRKSNATEIIPETDKYKGENIMREKTIKTLSKNGYFGKLISKYEYENLSDEEKAKYILADPEYQRYALREQEENDCMLELLAATYENNEQLKENNRHISTIKNILIFFLIITIISVIISLLSYCSYQSQAEQIGRTFNLTEEDDTGYDYNF